MNRFYVGTIGKYVKPEYDGNPDDLYLVEKGRQGFATAEEANAHAVEVARKFPGVKVVVMRAITKFTAHIPVKKEML